jgi:hypothetical protein
MGQDGKARALLFAGAMLSSDSRMNEMTTMDLKQRAGLEIGTALNMSMRILGQMGQVGTVNEDLKTVSQTASDAFDPNVRVRKFIDSHVQHGYQGARYFNQLPKSVWAPRLIDNTQLLGIKLDELLYQKGRLSPQVQKDYEVLGTLSPEQRLAALPENTHDLSDLLGSKLYETFERNMNREIENQRNKIRQTHNNEIANLEKPFRVDQSHVDSTTLGNVNLSNQGVVDSAKDALMRQIGAMEAAFENELYVYESSSRDSINPQEN